MRTSQEATDASDIETAAVLLYEAVETAYCKDGTILSRAGLIVKASRDLGLSVLQATQCVTLMEEEHRDDLTGIGYFNKQTFSPGSHRYTSALRS